VNENDATNAGAGDDGSRAEYEPPTAAEIEVTGGTIEAAPVVGASCYR
jgi:hypothetical protein